MKILRNVISAIIGVPLYYLVSSILYSIFGFIVKIPILSYLLSYPLTPEWWAMIATLIPSMFITSFVVNKISSYKKIDISIIITFAIIGLLSSLEIVISIFVGQATFSTVLIQLFTIGSCVFACCEISQQ